jgi:hypothetical protein
MSAPTGARESADRGGHEPCFAHIAGAGHDGLGKLQTVVVATGFQDDGRIDVVWARHSRSVKFPCEIDAVV